VPDGRVVLDQGQQRGRDVGPRDRVATPQVAVHRRPERPGALAVGQPGRAHDRPAPAERLAAGVGPTFTPLLQRWNKALAGYAEAELTVAAEVLAAMTDCIDDAVTTLRRPAGP
jgi:hypothetical protein